MPLHELPHCVRVAYEQALREKIARLCPHYGAETVENVVNASFIGLEMRFNNDEMIRTLVRACELLAEDKVDLS